MTQKRRSSGLGRGLSSLLGVPDDLADTDDETSVSRETLEAQTASAEKVEKIAAAKKKTAKKSITENNEKTSVDESAQTPRSTIVAPEHEIREKSKQVNRPSDMFFGEPGEKRKSSISDLMSARTSGLRAPRKGIDGVTKTEEPVVNESVSRETVDFVETDTLFRELDVTAISPNPRQPREDFNEDELAELAASIREVGVLQPIVVRPVETIDGEAYELVMGERRWRATQLAGLNEIPAIIRDTADVDLLRDALLENLHRSQLNPLEEAAAYQNLLNEYACSQEELAQRIGRSRPRISNTLRLMNLPPLVQRRVAAGVLSAGHARALLGLATPAAMELMAQRIVNEGLSVRAVEELVATADAPRDVSRETRRREPQRHERLDYFANALSDKLDTSVKISLGAKKGRMSIEFASVDDLNRIMDLIAPDSVQ